MTLQKDLIEILACPKCKRRVKENGMFVICNVCKLAYPILNSNVPDMLIEDAWQLDKAKAKKFKHTLKL